MDSIAFGTMRKTVSYLLAATLILGLALIIVGTSTSFRDSEWIVFAGVALFVLAGVPAVGGFSIRASFSDRKKISHGLVALSSAAIMAVYAAGYEQTSSAADRFAEQAASPRRRPAPVASAPVALNAAPTAVPAAAAEAVVTTISSQPEVAVSSPAEPKSTQPVQPEAPAPVTAAGEVAAPAPVAAEPVAIASVQPAAAPDATPAAAPVVPPPVPAAPKPIVYEYNDGAFWGWGSCRHGDIQVQVLVESGKISSAAITKCQTLYPCTMIKTAPPQVVELQDPDKIDNVSGATDSLDAYYDAVIDALNKALK